jgi:hypothetical protein
MVVPITAAVSYLLLGIGELCGPAYMHFLAMITGCCVALSLNLVFMHDWATAYVTLLLPDVSR